MFSVLVTNFSVSENKISKAQQKHHILKHENYFSSTHNNFLHVYNKADLHVRTFMT